MDGRTLRCGAVAAVSRIRNPIAAARYVMEKTPHVLFVGPEADRQAEVWGIEIVEPEYFRGQAERPYRGPPLGTVGAVALDTKGNLAAATSTGGWSRKMAGRVGDSPIIGAGTYAANGTCAVSCTGRGEEFIRRAVAYDIHARMAYKGLALSDAAREVVHEYLKPGMGGVIAVGADGSIVMEFNTTGMWRAAADANGYEVMGIWEGAEPLP